MKDKGVNDSDVLGFSQSIRLDLKRKNMLEHL